jgi:hypothetical protein
MKKRNEEKEKKKKEIKNMPEPYRKESIDNKILYPICKEISRKYCKNIDPNEITIVNFILGIIIIYYLYKTKFHLPIEKKIIVLLLLTLRAILDGLDGTVARMYEKTSKLGAILDEWSDIIFFAGLILIIFFESKIYSLFLFFLFLTYYLKLDTDYITILHDNTLLVTPLIILIMFILKYK